MNVMEMPYSPAKWVIIPQTLITTKDCRTVFIIYLCLLMFVDVC